MTPETQARQQIDQRLDESTGQIIRFTDCRDPAPRSREIFHFFKPAQLAEWLGQPESLRRRLAEQMPALPGRNLHECQISAVTGLEKPRGTFRAVGLADVERVRKAIWDNLHNRKQISVNLLSEQQIAPVTVAGKTVLRVEVPRASRHARPVHLGSNPLGGTYLRRHEGDYQADDETVRRMMAERVEDSRDEKVLKGFDFGDLDMDTVAAYRNRFAAVKPGHVWADLAVPDFLECIGATGKNRDEPR